MALGAARNRRHNPLNELWMHAARGRKRADRGPMSDPAGLTSFCTGGTDICMRTTLDFDDQLLRQAKKRATEDGESLTRLIEKALRGYLRPARRGPSSFRLRLLTKRGRPVAGVNWDDRDSLYERMEGRS